MNISDKNHPHHAVWREHVQSVLDGEPKVVQWKRPHDNAWFDGAGMEKFGIAKLAWLSDLQYRIKPRTIIRTITYPEPMKEKPPTDVVYWTINPASKTGIECVGRWLDDIEDNIRFSRNMCFATEADAKAAAQAIFGIES